MGRKRLNNNRGGGLQGLQSSPIASERPSASAAGHAAMSMARLWRDQGKHRTLRSSGAYLRLVHRRLRHAGPARRQGDARRVGVTQFYPCSLGVTRDFAMCLLSQTCRAASATLYHHVSQA